MTAYTARADRQVETLRQHDAARERPEAIRALGAALLAAEVLIDGRTASGLPAPRPYPSVRRVDRLWLKSGRYRVAYTTTSPPVIVGVFDDMADIPGRI